jgi:hypothetical protein
MTAWDGTERRVSQEAEILRKLDHLVEFIEGNGKPGAKIRLDRLERVMNVTVWAGGVMVVSCLGFAGWMVQIAFARVFQ